MILIEWVRRKINSAFMNQIPKHNTRVTLIKTLTLALLLCLVYDMPESRAIDTEITIEHNAPMRRITVGEYGWTGLMEASLNGDTAAVKSLVAKGADVNAKDDSGATALLLAASGGHTAIIHILLEHGADVNAKTKNGETALIAAVQHRHKDVVDILLAKGADVNWRGGFSNLTAMEYAAANGYSDVFQILLAKGAQVTDNALRLAVINGRTVGHVNIVQALLAKEADVNTKISNGETVLMFAARQGYTAIVQSLLDRGAGVNLKSETDATALILAASGGHAGIVRALVDKGADLNRKNRQGETALLVAIEKGYTAIAQILLDKGAEINIEDDSGLRALLLADWNGHNAVVKAILDREAQKKGKKQEGVLLYFQKNNNKCDFKQLRPLEGSVAVLLSLQACPDDVFVMDEANTVIVRNNDKIQEIVLKPNMILKPPLQLLQGNQIKGCAEERDICFFSKAGYLKDGRMAAVYQKIRPADDSDLYLFAYEKNKWSLIEERYCGRFDGDCLKTSVGGKSWRSWPQEKRIWHPGLTFNKLVMSRGVATLNGENFVLNERSRKPWHYIKFSINNHQSVLYYFVEEGDESFGPYTFSIYLQTYKDNAPVKVTEDQNDNAIEFKYLLLNAYRRGGASLIDIETGEELIKGLIFPFWFY